MDQASTLRSIAASLYTQLVESVNADVSRCNVCSHQTPGSLLEHLVTCHRELLESEGDYLPPSSIASAMKRRRRSRFDDSDREEEEEAEEEGDSLLHVKPSPIATKTRSRKRDTTMVNNNNTRIVDDYDQDEDEDFEMQENSSSGDNTESESSSASEESASYSNRRGKGRNRRTDHSRSPPILREPNVRSKRSRIPARRVIKSSLYQKTDTMSTSNHYTTDILSDDDDFDEGGADMEEIRKKRLQKLLNKTDKIVSKMEESLKDFIAQTLALNEKDKRARENHHDGDDDGEKSDENINTLNNSTDDKEEGVDSEMDATANAAVKIGDDPLITTTTSEKEKEMSIHTPYLLTSSVLRDYQVGGVEWLSSLHAQGLNGILADEMGLGKTLQVLSFLYNLWERSDIWGPHIIVMPLSVLSSWQAETKRFKNGIFDVYVHHGQKDDRHDSFDSWKTRATSMKRLVSQQLTRTTTLGNALKRGGGVGNEDNTDVIDGEGASDNLHLRALKAGVRISLFLTTYDIAIKDSKLLQRFGKTPSQAKWQYLIVDEAHRLKNRSSILFDALGGLKTQRRLLLSGTPLQNNLNELFSLLSFVLPKIFSDIEQFVEWFNRPFAVDSDEEEEEEDGGKEDGKGKKGRRVSRGKNFKRQKIRVSGTIQDSLSTEERHLIVSSLHRIMKPFLLRRLKADVVHEVPLKIERHIICPLSDIQRKIYNIIRDSVEMSERLRYEDAASNWKDTSMSTISDPNNTTRPARNRQLDRLKEASEGWYGADLGENMDHSYRLFNNGVSFNNVLMQLRKLCNHPYLVLEDMLPIQDELYFEYLIKSSGKMCVLERLMYRLLPKGHKILIFSQMTTTLDILQGYFQTLGISTYRLDGSTSREVREANIAEFNEKQWPENDDNPVPGNDQDSDQNGDKKEAEKNASGDDHGDRNSDGEVTMEEEGQHISGARTPPPDISTPSSTPQQALPKSGIWSPHRVPIYLLSTRAGGVGINLQAADTVIFFDSDWNPQSDLQALSRAHRLGQTEKVLVLRLISGGEEEGVPSAEQRILKAASHKLAAEKIVLAEGQFDMGISTKSKREKELLEDIPYFDNNVGILSLFSSLPQEEGGEGESALYGEEECESDTKDESIIDIRAASTLSMVSDETCNTTMESISEVGDTSISVQNLSALTNDHDVNNDQESDLSALNSSVALDIKAESDMEASTSVAVVCEQSKNQAPIMETNKNEKKEKEKEKEIGWKHLSALDMSFIDAVCHREEIAPIGSGGNNVENHIKDISISTPMRYAAIAVPTLPLHDPLQGITHTTKTSSDKDTMNITGSHVHPDCTGLLMNMPYAVAKEWESWLGLPQEYAAEEAKVVEARRKRIKEAKRLKELEKKKATERKGKKRSLKSKGVSAGSGDTNVSHEKTASVYDFEDEKHISKESSRKTRNTKTRLTPLSLRMDKKKDRSITNDGEDVIISDDEDSERVPQRLNVISRGKLQRAIQASSSNDHAENGIHGKDRSRRLTPLSLRVNMSEGAVWNRAVAKAEQAAQGHKGVKDTKDGNGRVQSSLYQHTANKASNTVWEMPDSDSEDIKQAGTHIGDTKMEAEVPVEDICVICGLPWVSASDLQSLIGSTIEYSTSTIQPSRISESQREQTMLICDGCSGSFHLVCEGMITVPNGDWYCRFCSDKKGDGSIETTLEEQGKQKEDKDSSNVSENGTGKSNHTSSSDDDTVSMYGSQCPLCPAQCHDFEALQMHLATECSVFLSDPDSHHHLLLGL